MNVIDALITAHRVFTETSRRSGRTTRMLAAYRDGDLLVFGNARHARHMCRNNERFAVATNLDQLHRALNGRVFNNIYLDHSVEEMIALDCLEQTKMHTQALIKSFSRDEPVKEEPYVRFDFMR